VNVARAVEVQRADPDGKMEVPMLDVEAEFDRFAHSLVAGGGLITTAGRRGPVPTTSAASVFARAIDLIRRDGADNLTARALAADLGISTRTLYKRIGSRVNLIQMATATHCATLDLTLRPHASWTSAAMDLCTRLYRALTVDSRMTELITDHLDQPLREIVDELVGLAIREGLSPQLAEVACRALVRITLNEAMSEVRSGRDSAQPRRIGDATGLESTLLLILEGVGARCRDNAVDTTT
jgi:AcrR family transcriptional regulator